ncbi:hypothetical protein MT418_8507 [Batrachochytrium dendrobatidis]
MPTHATYDGVCNCSLIDSMLCYDMCYNISHHVGYSLYIQQHIGVIDCRSDRSNVNMFVQQFGKTDCPWIIITRVNADLIWDIQCCWNINTTSTPNIISTLHVDVDECNMNIETMHHNAYKSQIAVQTQCKIHIVTVWS